jgi:hypothetical protein
VPPTLEQVTGVGAFGSIIGTWIYLPAEAKTGYRTANAINLTAACVITAQRLAPGLTGSCRLVGIALGIFLTVSRGRPAHFCSS